MISRGVFIVFAVAFVLVASSNVISALPDNVDVITRSFEMVKQAIGSSAKPSQEQIQAACTLADFVDKNKGDLDKVLPSNPLDFVFKGIRCEHASLRTFAWEIMEVLTGTGGYVEEAVKGGLVDDISSSIESAKGDEERFIFETLEHITSNGHYRDDSKFLREKIIPLLKYQVAHKRPWFAIVGARSLRYIVEHNDKSISEYLFESGVAQVIIEQFGERSDFHTGHDIELLKVVQSMASRSNDLKVEIAKLDFIRRIYWSLNNNIRSIYVDTLRVSCLSTLSKLVENSVEAAESLIEQGLGSFVLDCIIHHNHKVKKEAVMVLYELVTLDKPLELLKSIMQEGFYAIGKALNSHYKDIMTNVDRDHREKFETVYQTFKQ